MIMDHPGNHCTSKHSDTRKEFDRDAYNKGTTELGFAPTYPILLAISLNSYLYYHELSPQLVIITTICHIS